MRSFFLLTATVSATAALGLAAPLPASAAPANAVTSAEHCVLHTAAGGTMSCYRTFTEAIADATGGRVANAPRDVAAAMADTGLDRRLNALGQAHRDAVVGIEYEDMDYGGASTIVEADGGCDDDDGIEVSAPYFEEFWNDRITSFKTYVQCQANHYQHIDYEGTRTGWLEDTANIGPVMNDRTSSIQWR
ncbi:hypothetical protein GCM10022254_61100 [Actinomadura meridiana]|uniref:Uncharacterized protein n=1 Tax=Actinomadura meridiana TaxID=559626 RepID=A0ABP8CIF0_9ACTN